MNENTEQAQRAAQRYTARTNRPGVLGVLSLGGFPGNYTLRPGLTGTEIISGSKAEIIAALEVILKDK